jgi:hypothetical protein
VKSADETKRETEALVRAERRKQADLRALDRIMEHLAGTQHPPEVAPRGGPHLTLVPDEE